MRFTPKHPPETRATTQVQVETMTLSLREIARRRGIPRSTLDYWVAHFGWRRPAGAGTSARTSARTAGAKIVAKIVRVPTPAQTRRSRRAALMETAEEARRQVAQMRACPLADAAARERFARTLASLPRTIRQCEDALAPARWAGAARDAASGRNAPAPRSAPENASHDHGRSLAELRDEFVRLLARAVADGPDRGSPGGLQ